MTPVRLYRRVGAGVLWLSVGTASLAGQEAAINLKTAVRR